MDLKFGDYVECKGHVVVFQSDGRKFVEVSSKNVTVHRPEFVERAVVVVTWGNGEKEIGVISNMSGGYGKPFVSTDRGTHRSSGSTSFLNMRLATESEVRQYNKECAEAVEKEKRQKIADVATETLLAELADRLKPPK